jgi:glycosyltransferase involved in cell wall biosynthesis
LVAAAHEDFGLTPIEAAAFGKPCAVLASGGFLDTVVDGETGFTFQTPTPEAVAEAIDRVLRESWVTQTLVSRADLFSEAAFAKRLRELVETAGGEIKST